MTHLSRRQLLQGSAALGVAGAGLLASESARAESTVK
jgi:hypothetical protein